MEKTSEELYKERLKRVQDAIELKKPDRVPLVPVIETFPLFYTGITLKEAMNDYDKAAKAFDKFIADFEPDLAWGSICIIPAKVLERLDLKWFRWPGHGLPDNRMYQFVEGEYMKADEYDEFIYDPTHFILTKYLPRIFGSLRVLEKLPPMRNSIWLGWFGTIPAFAMPEIQDALKSIMEAAEELAIWYKVLSEHREKLKKMGYPMAYGGWAFAPYDLIGDTLRGTRGIMLDLYRQPDKLLKAIEKMTPISIEMGVRATRASGVPFAYIWLHKGCAGFMSDEQFQKFYWPSLRDQIAGFIDAGLTPIVWIEGDYTPRLKYLTDVPRGKVVYHFEVVDIVKAKETLGGIACINGSVPNSLLISGTPDEVKDYCKMLIDILGKDGGFMMETASLLEEAKPENVKAMFEFTKEYGVYK
ncbi:hypothetical protein ES707_08644 [subsurface metagenome]